MTSPPASGFPGLRLRLLSGMEGPPRTLKPGHCAKRETGGGKGHPVKLRVRFFFFFFLAFIVPLLSYVRFLVTPWTVARQASLSITNSQSLLKAMSIESVMPSNHLILCRPLLLLPSVFPSIRVFSNESALHISWYFWRRWVFVAAWGLSLVAASRVCSLVWCLGFPMRWLLLLRIMGSKHVGSAAVVPRLSCPVACGISWARDQTHVIRVGR